MGLIRDLTPLNLLTEKQKFFADTTYNPQFKYIRKFSKAELYQYGFPKAKLVAFAEMILKKYPGRTISNREILSKTYIKQQITDLFQKLGLTKIPIYFSTDFSFSAMLSSEGLFFREPVFLSKEELISKLNHEIQTHLLRRINHQHFFGKKIKIEDEVEFKKTEEGLAVLNYYIQKKNKFSRKSFVSYYSVYLTQKYSFAKSFAILRSYQVNEKMAWNLLVQKKRGLEDTSQPGGFTKDLVYLEGMVKVAKWLLKNQTPNLLYAGRISLKQADQLKNTIDQKQILLPTFLADQKFYLNQIKKIVEANHLDELF